MALPGYQVLILHPETGNLLYLFDGVAIDQLKYSIVLNDIGVSALSVPATDDVFDSIPWDAFMEVQREHPITGALTAEETYLVRIKERFREEDTDRMVIGGVSLNHLLSRRVIDPEDDPLEAGGYSTKSGAADEVIREYVREQAADLASADRSFPGLTVDLVTLVGQPVGARLRYDNLLEMCQDLSKKGEVDFTIRRTTGANMAFSVGRIGADKTRAANQFFSGWIGLEPKRGNLTEPNLTLDRKDEKNYIYMLGQGEGTNRIVLKLAGEGADDSPFNRIEFQEDGRNVEKDDSLSLLTSARAAIENEKFVPEFSYRATGREPGYVYREDWIVGDRVTVIWGGQEFDLRIVEVEITISGSEGETIEATLESIL